MNKPRYINTKTDGGSNFTSFAIDELNLRQPRSEDGYKVWSLISQCSPLDTNSVYCNLLQCTHFSRHCILAEHNDTILGWISAYLMPEEPETLFVWQVAVHPDARGHGLAKKLLLHLISQQEEMGVTCLKTTITGENDASWALFQSIAFSLETSLNKNALFLRDKHFSHQHETEYLATIGPWH